MRVFGSLAHGEANPASDSTCPSTSSPAAPFIFIGADAETSWLPPEIALDRRGYVLTGPEMQAGEHWALDRDPFLLETSVPGVFACGDVRFGPVKRVAAAVGEGSMAIAFVHQYLRELDLADAASQAGEPTAAQSQG